jgi:hypothetical protein
MVLCAKRRDDSAPDAGVLSDAKTLDDLADFMTGKILSHSASPTSIRLAGMTTSVPARTPLRPPSTRPHAHRRHVRRDCAALRPAESR